MRVPPLLAGLVDDAVPMPLGGTTLREAFGRHRTHRRSWYAELIGPLLLPTSRVAETLTAAAQTNHEVYRVGMVGDAGPAPAGLRQVTAAVDAAARRPDLLLVRQVEVPVAMRGEDPRPGLQAMLEIARSLDPQVAVYAEIPLTWGLLASLDRLAEQTPRVLLPKFRTGGLAAELFPTPVELAAVICACRDRELPFKLTAGLRRAIRRTDPETGLINHGFLNILAAILAADSGAEPVDLAEILGGTDPLPVVDAVRGRLESTRPLWQGFGCSNLVEPLADLRSLGLLPASPPALGAGSAPG